MWHDNKKHYWPSETKAERKYRKRLEEKVWAAFDRDALARVCAMHESDFARAYDMTRVEVPQMYPADFYLFRDNGSHTLAVAHLDTVQPHEKRKARFLETAGGLVVYSGALDDRLGAYIILELLPKLGVEVDLLLTVGEESGQSTAAFFEPEKDYDWGIEFDRGGTDVVMYQYEDDDTTWAVRESGARVGDGIFSDIAYLEHVGCKMYNWGVGYQDYHSARSHAYLDDTVKMVGHFLKFHEVWEGMPMPHEPTTKHWWERGYSSIHVSDYSDYDSEGEAIITGEVVDERECDRIFGEHNHDDDECRAVLAEFGLLDEEAANL